MTRGIHVVHSNSRVVKPYIMHVHVHTGISDSLLTWIGLEPTKFSIKMLTSVFRKRVVKNIAYSGVIHTHTHTHTLTIYVP